jgi:general secretion pathway protein M
MAPSLPTGRTGQVLALGLVAVVLTVLCLGVVMPLTAWHSAQSETLAQQVAVARRMTALVAAIPALEAQAASMADKAAGASDLLEGDTDSMAAASLQERLNAMFLRAKVRLNSVETLPGVQAGAYSRIRLRVTFDATWPVLVALLQEIQAATPVLLVDEMQVRPTLHRFGAAPDTLGVMFSLVAFRSGTIQAAAR